ncbi:MAG: myo-inositol-1-phosphate synthase [wastewater metagenome]|nr:myo-inositol-1-phosphate synthase [Candidatus Loosdrechtia aerotolerans]
MSKEKVGILLVGLNGATANTTVAGSLALKRGLNDNCEGMITETEIFSHMRLALFDQFVFGGWDVNPRDAYQAACFNKVLDPWLIEELRQDLETVRPWKAVVTAHDVDSSREAGNIIEAHSLQEGLNTLKQCILSFKARYAVDNVIVVYLASPLKHIELSDIHNDLSMFRKAITNNDESVSSAMLYALAAIETGCAFVDFTPNVTLKVPAIIQLAAEKKVPLAGRDGNTGQTLIKTVLGQMFRIRNLKLQGWYSTNILGNNDGLVLSMPEHRKIKMEDKLGVLEPVLGYNHFSHIVDIHYYPPRGDNKEAWESIDFSGWLGMPMSAKINWLGRDSILASPLIIDLVRLLEFALRRGDYGIQPQLAIYFKHPLNTSARGFFDQYTLLKNYYSEIEEPVPVPHKNRLIKESMTLDV